MGAHKGRSRLVSIAILLVGILVLGVVYRGEGHRRVVRAAQGLSVGDDSAAVLASLGVPAARCRPGELAHLRELLRAGAGRPVADAALERLRRETTGRWVWGRRAGCTPRRGQVEVGLNRAGEVLWAVPEHGEPAIIQP